MENNFGLWFLSEFIKIKNERHYLWDCEFFYYTKSRFRLKAAIKRGLSNIYNTIS